MLVQSVDDSVPGASALTTISSEQVLIKTTAAMGSMAKWLGYAEGVK